MFTVEDRDMLFHGINRQVLALTARMKAENVIGLNHTLLLELVQAGCSCPAFNERQRFTLIVNAELKPPEPVLLKKFWPFDTLGKRADATDAEVMVCLFRGVYTFHVDDKFTRSAFSCLTSSCAYSTSPAS
jgi:hypothetical protein